MTINRRGGSLLRVPREFMSIFPEHLRRVVLNWAEAVTEGTSEHPSLTEDVHGATSAATAHRIAIRNAASSTNFAASAEAGNPIIRSETTAVSRTLLAQETQAAMRSTGLGISTVGSTLITQTTQADMRTVLGIDPFTFTWSDKSQAPFYRAAANTLKVREKLIATVNGTTYEIAAETAITMPGTVTAGEDYAIWLQPDGTLVSTADFVTPLVANSRLVGQWHSLCANVGTISSHPLTGFLAGDILPLSIQSIGFRPKCNDRRGMVYDPKTRKWIDIYLSTVASGELASISGAAFVTGATTEKFHAYKFDQWLGRIGKRTLTSAEFVAASIGSNQGTNVSGSANPVTTGGHSDTAGRRMISNIGCEGCCGVLWQWGRGDGSEGSSAAWVDAFDANDSGVGGQHYSVPNRPVFGGNWNHGAICGSRGASWSLGPLFLYSGGGVRGLAEPE
jgi:hypothetical protein